MNILIFYINSNMNNPANWFSFHVNLMYTPTHELEPFPVESIDPRYDLIAAALIRPSRVAE